MFSFFPMEAAHPAAEDPPETMALSAAAGRSPTL
jgi:hypothetical protein